MAEQFLSTLIVGGTPQEREVKAAELTVDVRFQTTTFDCRDKKTIADVRALTTELRYKPSVEKRAVVIILEVQLLSVDAQSTLLKMIEEPPTGFAIYISADQIGNALPTIVSRCKIVNLGKRTFDEERINSYLAQPLSKQFESLDELDLDDVLYAFSQRLQTSAAKEPVIRLIEKAFELKKKTASAPINKKLVKEYLLIELHSL